MVSFNPFNAHCVCSLPPGVARGGRRPGHRGAAAQDGATPTAGMSPATAIVYMTIANDGDNEDVLLGGETDAATTVELHESIEDDGILRMEPARMASPSRRATKTVFDAGGLHVMLVGLTADLLPGGSYDLVLRFEQAGEVTVPVQIRFNAEPDDDEPVSEPVTSGDLTITRCLVSSGTGPARGGARGGRMSPPDSTRRWTSDGLTVVLTADGAAAGPRALTVIVTHAAGEPVTDATVSIGTSSLEMDHGVSTSETEMIEPGRYLADHVSMGMGGDWKAEVSIERPDTEAVVVEFVVTLDGPQRDDAAGRGAVRRSDRPRSPRLSRRQRWGLVAVSFGLLVTILALGGFVLPSGSGADPVPGGLVYIIPAGRAETPVRARARFGAGDPDRHPIRLDRNRLDYDPQR